MIAAGANVLARFYRDDPAQPASFCDAVTHLLGRSQSSVGEAVNDGIRKSVPVTNQAALCTAGLRGARVTTF